MFSPVSSRVSFPQIEEAILAFWKEKRVFERSVEARKGKARFVLYEGPPTANGRPGIHHVLSRVFKDIIPRYKVMKGYYAPRIAGWDTHGLPVELEVEKKLGLSNKTQIEEYGVARFNAECRKSVFDYLKEWDAMTERIGYWVDLKNAYVTMNNTYIETCWWTLKQMWDKGLIYQGYRVTPHCPRCGTSLSSHEVALGYKDDTEDPSVYIKFKVSRESVGNFPLDKPAYFLVWTTTPWTLPGNTALAVAPDAEYSIVEVDNEYLVLASARLDPVGLADKKVIHRVRGSDLGGEEYERLYEIPIAYSKEDKKRGYRVIEGDFVSMEDGTGIVHVAPAYGEIDFEIGEKEGLPLVHTVDLTGLVKKFPSGFTSKYREEVLAGSVIPVFGPEVPNIPGSGKFVKEADKDILRDLKTRGLLFRRETIKHTYPFCWRCDTPVLYYAKETWYIRTTSVKEALIAGNNELNWYPEHIKYGRFGDWLENNVDWAFSRERYWGTPLPIWQCEACDYPECIGGLDELKGKPGFTGLKEPLDLHRPFVDEFTYDCPKCGGRMERVPEVIDCWFDSGAMPIAQYHYPFENKTLLEDGRFPADFICEAVDQTRGWFYSLHAISTLLFNRNSFKNVICLGHILDAKGEKMSKARGNVIEPMSVINKYGADAVRWYFYTSSPPGNVRRFSEKLVSESRNVLSTLWNVYSFFVTYANIDKFNPATQSGSFELAELDRWIISELNQLILDVDKGLDSYDPTEAGRKIEGFVDNLSNWYVRRSRRRFWKSGNDTDKLAAYSTLYECLVALSKLLAPFIPFLADEIYRNLVCTAFPDAPESVHLADFPRADEAKIDKQLSDDIRLAMRVSSLGRAARSKRGIKVRQPLEGNYVSFGMEQALKSEAIKQSVLDELNVKWIKLATSEELAAMAKNLDYVVDDESSPSTAIYTKLTPALEAEGMAREIVHRLQMMRRSAGFDIADYITTYYQAESYIKQVMTDFADYIKQETLSRELVDGTAEEAYTETHKLGDYEIRLGVKKLG